MTNDEFIDDFVLTHPSQCQCVELREDIARLSSKIDAVLSRLEVEDARRQNKAIRTHAAVPAFKSSSTPTATSLSAPFFSFLPR